MMIVKLPADILMAESLCLRKIAAKMMVNSGLAKIRAIASPTLNVAKSLSTF